MIYYEKIGTLDFETDPFLHGRIPTAFAGCIWFPGGEHLVWGDDDDEGGNNTAEQISELLYNMDKCTLYAHNGGKFDFHFLLPYADTQQLKIINGRIAKMTFGNVTLIDSFLLMPFALEQYKKTPIDYSIFEIEKRNIPKNKKRITAYLQDDCRDLYNLVTGFHYKIGNHLTIGAAAFSAMKKIGYVIPKLGKNHDMQFRPFYYGGRCEAFKTGIFKRRGGYQYIDINSAYPRAMKDSHPTGADYEITKEMPNRLGPQFFNINAIARGCFPFRDEKGGLFFPNDNTERNYFITGWELAAAINTNSIGTYRINAIYVPKQLINFREYVETFYKEKLAAKIAGDRIGELAMKYLLNSGYGKFATDPEKFKSYWLKPMGENWESYDLKSGSYLIEDENDFVCDVGHLSLWSHPDYNERGYYDVATAASITGWVRAYLWRAICMCKDVLYCDTDSIICTSHNLPLSDDLGEWKLEAHVVEARIAGKKLYSINTKEDGWKTASKGVRIDEVQMQKVCQGGEATWHNPAPSFRIGKKDTDFVKRTIKIKKK